MASSRSHLPLPLLINSSAGGVKINLNPNSDSNSKPKVKQTKGRRKIPIKKIENKNKKHVTFSKRRKGLFTKASELCVLCGASVAVITFSEAGKVFSFGHPSPDAVIHRYLHGNPAAASSSSSSPLALVNSFDSLSNNHTSTVSAAAAERQFWWEHPVEELGFEEVEAFAAALEVLRSNVDRKIAELDCDRTIVPVKTEGIDNRHHHHHLMMMREGITDYLSLPVPPPAGDHQQNQQYYQACGCGCTEVGYEGIGMAEFNRFGR